MKLLSFFIGFLLLVLCAMFLSRENYGLFNLSIDGYITLFGIVFGLIGFIFILLPIQTMLIEDKIDESRKLIFRR